MNPLRKLLLVSLFLPFGALAEGSVGITAEVSVDGFFSPEITEFKINEVRSGSPAEKAGVKIGQLVIELDGCKIPGCSASKAKKIMDKEAGEVLPLLVKNQDGSEILLKIHVGE